MDTPDERPTPARLRAMARMMIRAHAEDKTWFFHLVDRSELLGADARCILMDWVEELYEDR